MANQLAKLDPTLQIPIHVQSLDPVCIVLTGRTYYDVLKHSVISITTANRRNQMTF